MKTFSAAFALVLLASSAPALAADTSQEVRTGAWRPTRSTVVAPAAVESPVVTGPVAPTKPGLRTQAEPLQVTVTTGTNSPTKPGAASLARR